MRRETCKRSFIFFSSVFLFFMMGGCTISKGGIQVGEGHQVSKGGPPPHAPAHGYRAKHKYHYYPSAYVYFDVTRNVYFYLEGNVWRTSVVLPETYRVRITDLDYEDIDLDEDKPYTHFDDHKKKFPPGQDKKKPKKN